MSSEIKIWCAGKDSNLQCRLSTIQGYSLIVSTVPQADAYLAESHGVDPSSRRSHGFQGRSQSRLRDSLNLAEADRNDLSVPCGTLIFGISGLASHAQRFRGGRDGERSRMSLSGTPDFQSGERPIAQLFRKTYGGETEIRTQDTFRCYGLANRRRNHLTTSP